MCSLGVGDANCSTSSTKYEGVKKIEAVTVFELNAYVVNSTPQVTEGLSAVEAASDELNSGRIIAEEQKLPGAGCPLKKVRKE
ncbi:hypothetical protein Bca4012_089879 [Brassica carinata]